MERDISHVLLTEGKIRQRIVEMAELIEKDYEGKNPLIVSVLKGSFIFMADLVRQLNISCGVDFMAVSSYGRSTASTGEVRILKDLDTAIEGRDLIVVEDILDSGLTLSYILNILNRRGICSVRLCTLLDKPERRRVPIKADYVGFVVPDEFVVGYGLDYAEKYRNLPYIGVLRREIYER